MMQKTILIVLLILILSRFDLFHQNKQNDKSLIEKKQDTTGARALRKNNLIQKRENHG